MCGICGFIDINNDSDQTPIIHKMNDALAHRGPDGSGVWYKKDIGLYLGHRRLSILDLSNNASQPFTSNSGRFTMTYNGEIYNFNELKNIIDVDLKSSSDTEILIEAIEKIGLDNTLKKIKGMFAFAIWDNKKNELTLCRDRMGEKPLYYGLQKGILFFSSELKALTKHPRFNSDIDLRSLSKYFSYGYIPAPYSIYNNIFKLLPGSYFKISYDDLLKNNFENIQPNQYWSFSSTHDKFKDLSKNLNEDEIISNLDSLLQDSIKMQMISDVPLGVFLSGGIDSSLIASVMQSQSIQPIRTFTIGFDQKEFNEAIYAKKIAEYLGTNHSELYISEKDALDTIPKIPTIYCEPFADSSQIPTYLVSKLARKNVTVSLSGDGGDELFYGYSRYNFSMEIWNKLEGIPLILRKVIAHFIFLTPKPVLDITFFWIKYIIRSYSNDKKSVGSLLKKSYQLLRCSSDENLYRYLIFKWIEPHSLVLNTENNYETFGEKQNLKSRKEGMKNHMMSFDAISYLPDDILVKVDRAAMAVSLETRVPLLDKDIVQFSMSISSDLKSKNNKKWILKKTLEKYLPSDLIDRPKMGFGVPLKKWLTNDLKDWACELLDERKLKNQGYLNHQDIAQKLQQHLAGSHDWHAHLWEVLVFQQWLESNK